MRRFRAYLVDDEPLALKRLARLLGATGRFEIAGSATDPEAALEWLRENAAEVLFLDIHMPGLSGFELLARLERPPAVIFTTAYDQYAVRAFEVSSIDYLLKPVEPEGLERAIRKLDRLEGGPPPDLRAVIERLTAPERVTSRTGERTHVLEVARISHFFARDKLTYAASAGHAYPVDCSIAELERRLGARNFVRIHRATLVNLDWIREIDSWFAGGAVVRLKDEKGTELAVARDRVRALRDRLGC